MISFFVPGPPKPWQRAQRGKHGSYAAKETAHYQGFVLGQFIHAAIAVRPIMPKTGRYRVTIEATFQDARRRDLDNIGKQVLDALNGGAWIDDSQVDDLRVTRRPPDKANPGLMVTVELLAA